MARRLLRHALFAAALCLAVGSSAQTVDEIMSRPRPIAEGKRIALIIGNGGYKSGTGWNPLPNAVHDAEHIAKLLSDEKRGAARFEVELIHDGTWQQIRQAVANFAARAKTADVALVYYSGHGFEYAKTNFIVPTDAPGRIKASEIATHYIDMETIAREAHARGFNMVFLDACRSRVPIVLRDDGTTKAEPATAFAAIQAPESIIFYASSPGGVAYDEAPPGSPLSPFAQALAYGMTRSGMDTESVFPLVATYVGRVTEERARPQQPQLQGSWTKLFYFLPEAVGGGGGPAPPRPAAPKRLAIALATLNTVDEPTLIPTLLADHPPAELRVLADGGDPLALYILGYMYSYGLSVPQDLAQAEAWLKRAAETDNAAGQLEYGYFLLHRSKAATAKQAARELYEKSAAQGYAKAKTHLASAFLNGEFGPTSAADLARAPKLLAEAGELGYAGAFANLIYIAPAKAMAGLEALAAKGNVDGDHWLCRVEADAGRFDEAAPHCLKAAGARYVNAQAQLALLYAAGKGVPASPTLARYWARIALSQDDLYGGLRSRIAPLAN